MCFWSFPKNGFLKYNLTPKNINMPSFDIESSVDIQALDNAVNVVKKEITNRFDFKGIHVVIDLNKKDYLRIIELILTIFPHLVNLYFQENQSLQILIILSIE